MYIRIHTLHGIIEKKKYKINIKKKHEIKWHGHYLGNINVYRMTCSLWWVEYTEEIEKIYQKQPWNKAEIENKIE